MTINQSARQAQLIIGGQDWSNTLLDVTDWSSTSIDASGLTKITATLRLIETETVPGSLDDRNNSHWRTGQQIIISVPKSDGAMERHPAGCLRILSTEFDLETRILTIKAACLITLLSFKAPADPDKIQPEPDALTPRNKIVTNLLNAAGINNVNNPWTLPHPLFGVQVNGSYLETCGRVLYSVGFFAYINKNETFCIKPINLLTNGIFTLKIGGDDGEELWYRRLKGAEGPREVIKVVGTAQVKQPDAFPKFDSITRYGDASQVNPESSGIIVTFYQEIEEDFNGNTRTIYTKSLVPLGILVPFLAGNYGATGLWPSEYRTEKKHYESGNQSDDEGKLLSIHSEASRPQGVENAEYWQYRQETDPQDPNLGNAKNIFLSEVSNTKYSYNTKNKPKSVETIKSLSTGKLLEGTSQDWSLWQGNPFVGDPDNLRLGEVSDENWKQSSANEWVHTTSSLKPLAQIKSGVASADNENEPPNQTPAQKLAAELKKIQKKLSLVSDDSASVREVSNSGQTNPPAPEHRPPKATFETEQIKGEAQFAAAGGNPFQERERTFQIEYLEGKSAPAPGQQQSPNLGPVAQCNKMAKIEGELLIGRHKGQDIGMNLRDELFGWEPLMRINCLEPDGTVRAYALDDSHWLLSSDKALASFGAIWVGTVGGSSTPIPVPAAPIPGTGIPATAT